ncbi:unnamed protein product [Phaedon cochleariae]|uniref:Uncharacterized protein n=1 Tax=Phaedon cochleariae TaxID=80249 RepID=A0A9N9SIU3_PHACE|nr:unnamed protein product [Phaedon cochleariae]
MCIEDFSCMKDLSIPRSWYNSFDKRLLSYRNWTGNQKPIELANAGFYFKGKDDIVECFQCGIEIHMWNHEDIPIEDHLKYSKICPYANLIKDILYKPQEGTKNEEPKDCCVRSVNFKVDLLHVLCSLLSMSILLDIFNKIY